MKTAKTNVARILDKEKVPYEIKAYDFDPEHLNALHAAESFGLEIRTSLQNTRPPWRP